jgi:hypothetical protein
MTSAERSDPDGMVERITRIAVEGLSHPDESSLLHAYIACLSVPLAATSKLRLALRRRLLRLLGDANLEHHDRQHFHHLIERIRSIGQDNPSVRPVVEALLSAAFEFLPPPQQQSIIEAWIDRGTRGAAGRWLKAVAALIGGMLVQKHEIGESGAFARMTDEELDDALIEQCRAIGLSERSVNEMRTSIKRLPDT